RAAVPRRSRPRREPVAPPCGRLLPGAPGVRGSPRPPRGHPPYDAALRRGLGPGLRPFRLVAGARGAARRGAPLRVEEDIGGARLTRAQTGIRGGCGVLSSMTGFG